MAAKAKTLADFRASHDKSIIIPNKIKAALAAMLKEGAEQYDYEVDFMRRAGISSTDMGQFRQMFEQDHVVNVGTERAPKRVWFADPKVARKARGA